MDKKRQQIIKEIFDGMLIMRRKLAERRQVEPAGFRIPPAQGIVLHIVGSRGSLSVKEIAEIMRVSGSAATQLVDSLFKAGLLSRSGDAGDRRVIRISLTENGKNQLAKLRKFQLEGIGRLLAPLSEPELEIFRDLQQKIITE